MSLSTRTASVRAFITCVVVCGLAACSTSRVVVEGRFPTPLVERQPVVIGLWFSDEFRNHEFSDEGLNKNSASWVVQTGKAQVDMWDTLFAGMFRAVTHLEAAPGHDSTPPAMEIDAVLVPHIQELQYAVPSHTNVKVYEIWMRYRFELLTPEGDPLGEWEMTSYGKTPTAFLRSDTDAVNLAAVMALRDAGANFVTSFHKVPPVEAWLQEKGHMDTSGSTL